MKEKPDKDFLIRKIVKTEKYVMVDPNSTAF